MNNLGAFKRIALTFTIMLIGINLWGQGLSSTLTSGTGTEEDPYQITSVSDWNTFASDVNVGYDYSGKYIKLENDIEINVNNGDEMVGVFVAKDNSDNRPFNGVFDGNWKTINFICGTAADPRTEVACTLFRYTTGVTISNLKVTGTIISSQKYAAGFIGWVQSSSETSVINCISSINIICDYIPQGSGNDQTKWYDCTYGGFVGQNESGTINITNCIFDGTIEDTRNEKKAQKCAGFIGWANGTKKYTDCTMAGTIDIATTNNLTATYHRGTGGNFTRAYYINNYSNQGTAALTDIVENKISKIYTANNTNYYVPEAVITGFEKTTFSGSDVPATITPVVKYYGWTLAWNTDYDIKVNGTLQESGSVTLSETGDYVFTIEGKGNYGGTFTKNVKVFDITTWVGLQAVLADNTLGTRNITLSSNVSPVNPASDGALEVKGTVVLDLNGYTINRNIGDEAVADGYVMKVASGANLTIKNGSATSEGVITGGYNLGDGGGIVNLGTLTLKHVTVSGNKVEENRSAYGVGAGIYNNSTSTLTIDTCIVKENVAIGGGGGVHSEKGTLIINGGEIKNNSSNNKGGGVRVKKNATITGCAIKDNLLAKKEANDGGGFYCDKGSTVTLIDCEISGNNAERWGGGIYIYGDNTELTLQGCRIENNTALTAGGGIYVYSGKLYIWPWL